jgi:hypothetical protein
VDVSGDTPMLRNWGDSVIEGGEVPVIVGTGAVHTAGDDEHQGNEDIKPGR